MGRIRNAYKILAGKPDGKRSLGRVDVHGRIRLKCLLRK
jgi:hypothetical protein